VVSALRAASDPTRARILAFLAGRPDLGATVTDVVVETGLGQPTVSHHLKVLSSHGLVVRDPDGQWVRYRLDPTTILALAEGVADLHPHDARAPDAVLGTATARRHRSRRPRPGTAPEPAVPTQPPTYPPASPSGRPLPSSRRGGGG
jgi:ArsR family transcriptional regulator